MKHFIITRNLYPDDYPYKNERLDLIRRFSIPSLKRQANKNFTWILTGSESLTEFELKGIDWVVARNPLTYIKSIIKNDEVIVSTRFDNDDYLLPNFVDNLQRIPTGTDTLLVDFAGYRVDLRYKQIYKDVFYKKFPSPFISLIQNYRHGVNDLAYVLEHQHTKMAEHYDFRRVESFEWIQFIHDHNKLMNRPQDDVMKRGELINVTIDNFLKLYNII